MIERGVLQLQEGSAREPKRLVCVWRENVGRGMGERELVRGGGVKLLGERRLVHRDLGGMGNSLFICVIWALELRHSVHDLRKKVADFLGDRERCRKLGERFNWSDDAKLALMNLRTAQTVIKKDQSWGKPIHECVLGILAFICKFRRNKPDEDPVKELELVSVHADPTTPASCVFWLAEQEGLGEREQKQELNQKEPAFQQEPDFEQKPERENSEQKQEHEQEQPEQEQQREQEQTEQEPQRQTRRTLHREPFAKLVECQHIVELNSEMQEDRILDWVIRVVCKVTGIDTSRINPVEGWQQPPQSKFATASASAEEPAGAGAAGLTSAATTAGSSGASNTSSSNGGGSSSNSSSGSDPAAIPGPEAAGASVSSGPASPNTAGLAAAGSGISYLLCAVDLAALAVVWDLAPHQGGAQPRHSWRLSHLLAAWEQPAAGRPPQGPVEVVVDLDEGLRLAKIAFVAPLSVLGAGLGLDVLALHVVSGARGFDLGRNLREPRPDAVTAPTCQLVELRVEADCPRRFAAACSFLSQTTFPRLETLWLAYGGRDRPACLSELTLGFQCLRFPRLRVLVLGPLPAALTGQVWADTDVVFRGYAWPGSSLGRRPARFREEPAPGPKSR
eukprot:g68939.t1